MRRSRPAAHTEAVIVAMPTTSPACTTQVGARLRANKMARPDHQHGGDAEINGRVLNGPERKHDDRRRDQRATDQEKGEPTEEGRDGGEVGRRRGNTSITRQHVRLQWRARPDRMPFFGIGRPCAFGTRPNGCPRPGRSANCLRFPLLCRVFATELSKRHRPWPGKDVGQILSSADCTKHLASVGHAKKPREITCQSHAATRRE